MVLGMSQLMLSWFSVCIKTNILLVTKSSPPLGGLRKTNSQ